MAPLNKSLKNKSRIPKMTTQTLLDFDLGEESSSDSDFRIEDHDESDDDFSEQNKDDEDTDDEDDSDDDDDEDDSDSGEKSDKFVDGCVQKNETTEDKAICEKNSTDLKEILARAAADNNSVVKTNIPTHPICCACLGDRSDDTNEIVECDGCGVSVHEGCYGVSDSISISSTNSSCSTEPWFCEACRAGVTNPSCELCPNKGGIFKETDVGKWVHLVCALYVPGVAFGEVDQLSSVTLFEMPYSKWGSKSCSLCVDERFARTGVCIGCDAGMCKSYFHVTCAQATGFLSEAHSEEVDHADPFYAHCKVHSDKTMIKHRKRNYNTLKLRMEQKKILKMENKNSEKSTTDQQRIQRKLAKHQAKYRSNKLSKNEPWVPTQKISRLLTTSATAVNRLIAKAEVMGVDTAALEIQEAQMAAIADIKKKWHIPPAFSVDFIAYYLDRISRLKDLKTNLGTFVENNTSLLAEQKFLREEYDQKLIVKNDLLNNNNTLKDSIMELHKQMSTLCPNKQLPTIENIGRPVIPIENNLTSTPPARPISVPTAAALKMGVGFPLTNLPGGIKDDTGRILSTQRQNKDELVHDCGICKRCNDQHLLAKCDTCHFYYHLGCLNPPLTRHPKTSKLYGWQCSECDKSDDSDAVVDMPKGPRKSRTRFSKDGTIVPVDPNLSSSNADGNSSTKSEFSPAKRKSSIDKLPMAAPAQKSKSVDSVVSTIGSNNSITINSTIMITATTTATTTTTTTSTTTTTLNGKILVPKDLVISSKKPYVKISKNKNQQNHMKCLYNNIEKIDINDLNNINDGVPPASIIINNSLHEIPTKQLNDNKNSPIKVPTEDPLAIDSTVEMKCIDETIDVPVDLSMTKIKSKDKSIKKEKKERKNCIDAITGERKKRKEKNSINCLRLNVDDVTTTTTTPITAPTTIVSAVSAVATTTTTTPPTTNQNDIVNSSNNVVNVTPETINTTNTLDGEQLSHRQNRKRRKDKHKSKYTSDSEKSPSKEHKRKRKKKNHDIENPNDSTLLVPKIKIKFKTLPLPGEAAPEPQFFYVSADMVRPMDTSRPTSVETVDDSTMNNDELSQISSPGVDEKLVTTSINSISKKTKIKTTPSSTRNPNKIKISTPKNNLLKSATITKSISSGGSVAKLSSPRKSTNKRRSTNSNNSLTSANNSVSSGSGGACDICHDKGTQQNSVQCDECHKIYHFTCLDPPLKKTPKHRGYSWHCADCDPTDIEGT